MNRSSEVFILYWTLDTVQSAWLAVSHLILETVPGEGLFSFAEEEIGPEA